MTSEQPAAPPPTRLTPAQRLAIALGTVADPSDGLDWMDDEPTDPREVEPRPVVRPDRG